MSADNMTTHNSLRRTSTLGSFLLVSAVFFMWFLHSGKQAPPTTQSSCSPSQPEPAKGRRALVTGAGGFIGSHVMRHCAEMGMFVVGIDDMSGGFYENVPKHENAKFMKGDVKSPEFLEKVFKEHGPFDFVYHLAAYAAEGLSHFIPSYNYRNNLVGSVEVLSLSIKYKVQCFVFTSSIAVYGSIPKVVTEDVIPTPEDPYGVSKYAMELHLQSAYHMHGMEYLIFRPHNVYGPNQNIADKYRNVVGIFMNEILHGKPLTIFGDGLQTRSFSYIDDVAPVLAMSPLYPRARNQIFNVGADTPYTLNDLAVLVSESMGVEPNVVHLDARKEVVHSEISNTKVRCYFQLPSPVTLKDGLNRTSAWVKAIGAKYSPVEFPAVEIISNMPPSWVRKDLKERAHIEHTSDDNPRVKEEERQMGNRNLD